MSATSLVMPNDLSDLCRVCLQLPEESQYLDLSTIYDEDDNLTYSECFTICTQIYLSAGQGVPHHLCKSCGLELQMSYDFRKKVEESNRVLQQYEKQMLEDENNRLNLMMKPEITIPTQNRIPEQQQLNEIINDQVSQSEESLSQQELFFSSSAADEEEMNGVDILSKVSPVKSSEDIALNMTQLDSLEECVEIEEHLEVEDFQNLETLEEEETETLQIKCDENPVPIQLIKYKTKITQDDEEVYYEGEEEQEENDENSQSNSQCVDDDEDDESYEDLTWQENVVAVANKEHLPVKINDDEEEEDEDVFYMKGEDYIILDEFSYNEAMEVEEKINVKHKKKDQNSNPNTIVDNNSTRKRRIGTYRCDYCQKLFPNYSRMVTHRRCHEADRPKYTCEHCGRMYATKQARESHIQTAHEKSGFTCNICNKVFAVRKSLEIHVRYHTGDFPYVCDLCGKKFAQACHLTTHKNVKHNSVRFCCDYPNCGKFFTSSTSLRNHEYSHGVMPFECEYCELGYPSKSKLKVHIKRKHGMDLNKDQLENMRKFHVMRSKLNVKKVVGIEDQET